MDVKQLAQAGADSFNDRSFRQNARDMIDDNALILDGPTGRELRGPDGYVQFSEGFVTAMPDIQGTVIEHQVNGNQVTSRIRGQGTFTGTMQTPQGSVPGNGRSLDIEYQVDQEFNDAGKIARFAVNYDMQDFMRQLGMG